MNNTYGQGAIQVVITKDHFDAVGRGIKKRLAAGIEFTGFGIEAEAKKDAAVDTGRYRSSIGHSQNTLTEKGIKQGAAINPHDAVWKLTEGIAGIWLYIGTNVEYAPDLEAKYGNLHKSMETMKGLLLSSLGKAVKGAMVI